MAPDLLYRFLPGTSPDSIEGNTFATQTGDLKKQGRIVGSVDSDVSDRARFLWICRIGREVPQHPDGVGRAINAILRRSDEIVDSVRRRVPTYDFDRRAGRSHRVVRIRKDWSWRIQGCEQHTCEQEHATRHVERCETKLVPGPVGHRRAIAHANHSHPNSR